MRQDQKLLLLATFTSLVAWSFSEIRWLVIPLVYLNTHVHEMLHALAAGLTGGSAERILVFANGSGVTETYGGFSLVVSSAGYVGATMLGGLIIVLARTPESARRVLFGMGVVLGFGMLLWVRGDIVGLLSGLAWIGFFVVAARYLAGPSLMFAAQFIGVQQCVTSLQAMLVLLQVSATTEHQSDAKNLEVISGIPAIIWASGWGVLSVVVLVLALKAAWTAPRATKPRTSP